MFWNCVSIYVASAIVTAVVVFVASKRVGGKVRPATQRTTLSLAAGLLWPLLLLAMFELSSIAMYTKFRRQQARGQAVVAWR